MVFHVEGEEPEVGALSIGLLAAVPLFAGYELALWMHDGAVRNTAELLAGRLFLLAAPYDWVVRWCALAAGFVFAVGRLRRREAPIAPAVARQLFEGLAAAVVIGPLLVLLVSFFDLPSGGLRLPMGPPGSMPPLERALRLGCGAVWEELLFRLAGYSLIYLGVARLAGFFGLARHATAVAAELAALLGSSVLFAALHLEVLTRLVGVGGEPFHSVVFLWRLLAGLVLAALFRWRGFGVAAWAHALFNVSLLLGAGPGVFGPSGS